MNRFLAGLGAGFIATVVLSAIMVAKTMMGVMPQLDVIAMLAAMMGGSAAIAWLAHFMIGTLAWGGGFSLLYKELPGGSAVGRGVVFGLLAWLAMMVVVMPIAGAGFFGLAIGLAAPMMTAMLHIVFGAVMGAVFARSTAGNAALAESRA